jgi:hypothetical protein
MSAGQWLQAAIVRQLRTRAALDGCAVFDMPPMRAALPHAVVEDPVLASWDAATVTGREGRITISVRDGGERPTRLRRLQGQVEDLVATMPTDLGGEGWRVVRLRLMRSRIARGKAEQWTATSEFEVRVYRANG